MPANKNAMTRYALIDKMLANRYKAYSIQDITNELAEKLPEFGQEPVSKRCVEKDLNYLEFDSPFDIEIEEYWVGAPDKNGKSYSKRCIRYLDPTFTIFKPKLTEDEKTVLTTALDTLGSFDGLENFEWLSDLKGRLGLEEHQPIISFSKNILDNSTLIARLFTSIKLKQVISLEYHTFEDSNVRIVEVCPYLLKEYNNRWFLIAAACDTGKILTFPLDRIDEFSISYIQKYISAPKDFDEYFEEIVGVTYNEAASIEEIIFWVSNKSTDYVLTKPIHGSQVLIRGPKDDVLRARYPKLIGGSYFKIKCKENYELIRELISFGPELIVVAPIHIVKKIEDRLKTMVNNYSNK